MIEHIVTVIVVALFVLFAFFVVLLALPIFLGKLLGVDVSPNKEDDDYDGT